MQADLIFYMYVDTQRQWRWFLQSSNGRKIANGGEGYHNKDDCIHAINLVAGSDGAPIRLV